MHPLAHHRARLPHTEPSEAAGAGPDQLALVRITRQRREAAERVTRDRDYIRFEAEMDRLNGEEVTARVATRAAVSAREVEEYLADLPGLYDAAEPATQKRMLQALFERIEVLGSNRVWLVPSTEAEERGLGPLFTGEFRTKVRQTGRGERRQTTLRHLNVPANLPLEIEVTGVERWLRMSTG